MAEVIALHPGRTLAEIEASIRKHGENMLKEYVAIGNDLIEAKQRCRIERYKWDDWLSRFGWSQPQAHRFMRIAEILQNSTLNFGELKGDATAFWLLCRPSTPARTREEIITKAKAADEPLMHQHVKAQLNKVPKNRKWPKERDAKLEKLRAQGLTHRQIGEKLGATPAAIGNRLAILEQCKHEARTPEERRMPPKMTDADIEKFFQLIQAMRPLTIDLDFISMYAEQMHNDLRHKLADELKPEYDILRKILKRLVRDFRHGIWPPACGVPVRVDKEGTHSLDDIARKRAK